MPIPQSEFKGPTLTGDHSFFGSLSHLTSNLLLGEILSLVMLTLAEVPPNDLSGLNITGKGATVVTTQ